MNGHCDSKLMRVSDLLTEVNLTLEQKSKKQLHELEQLRKENASLKRALKYSGGTHERV